MKYLKFMLIGLFICSISYASDVGIERVINDVWSDADNAFQATITGEADMAGVSADFVTARQQLSADNAVFISGDVTIKTKSGATTGNALAIFGGVKTTGNIMSIDATSLTTGNVLSLEAKKISHRE